LGVAVAVAGLVAASASASFPSPTGLNGWYTQSPVSGSVSYNLGQFIGPHIGPPVNGAVDTFVSTVTCKVGNVVVGQANGNFTSAGGPVSVNVSVSGDSPTSLGSQVTCSGQIMVDTWHTYTVIIFGIPTQFCCEDTGYQVDGTTLAATVATLKIDTSAPTNVTVHATSAPNANGWYKTAGIPVIFGGFDPNSDINFCRSGSPFGFDGAGQTIGGPDGANKVIDGGCQNKAGLNTTTHFFYNFDGTPPTLNPSVSPNPVLLGSSATASPGAGDGNGSGVDSSSCDPVDTSVLGAGSVNCTATDLAGNTNSALASYTVSLGFDGFFDPVDMNMINVAKAGQAIPLKFDVYDANGPVSDLGSVSVTTQAINCSSLSEASDAVEEYAAGGSGLQNLGLGNYQFNWKTPKTYAGTCERVHLDTGDGISHTADFQFTK
jgi:hypothetical protein